MVPLQTGVQNKTCVYCKYQLLQTSITPYGIDYFLFLFECLVSRRGELRNQNHEPHRVLSDPQLTECFIVISTDGLFKENESCVY